MSQSLLVTCTIISEIISPEIRPYGIPPEQVVGSSGEVKFQTGPKANLSW